MNEKNTGTVVYKLDLDNLPPLSEEHERQLEHLRTMKDEDIDFSDIPRTKPGTKWQRPGRLIGASSPEVVALDADLFGFFESGGRADAVKVNAALREYVANHSKA
jgi:uncharacterized protein (DUF4415 family)